MMENNYDQEDYGRQMKGIIMMEAATTVATAASRLHEVEIETKNNDFVSATTGLSSDHHSEHKQNFNFGAEIVQARQQQHKQISPPSTIEKQLLQEEEEQQQQKQEHIFEEEASKTNVTKTNTLTVTPASPSAAAAAKVDDKIENNPQPEIPINVSELPLPENAAEKVYNESFGNAEDRGKCQLVQAVGEMEDEEDDDEEDDDDEGSTKADTRNASSQPETNNDVADADADDDSDDSGSDSDFSDISGLSDMSGREWKPISAHPINWVQKQIMSGANPRELLSQMLPTSANQIATGLNDVTLWRILASLISEPPRRQKLRHVNTFDDVIDLIKSAQNIIVLTGAGVSVSCGIPDFRSSDGIYSRLAKDYPDLPDPQAMFDIGYFSRDPRPFFKFAREIYPGQFKPSPCHRFIKLLEQKQKLLRNYTQNIDTLEQVAGIKNVIECHGSFSSASCTKCRHKCDADAIRADIFAQRIPVCPRCQPNVQQSVDASQPVSEMELKRLVENGIMKPDIVFFGEGLPQEFHTVMACDKDKCDLLIVMGSSLKVRPVALIPSSIPANVPQILINREQLHHLEFDVELLGDSDVIINQLCHCLGDEWQEICFDRNVLKEAKELLPLDDCIGTEGEDGCGGDGEEDAGNAHDTDTQSVQSYASTDIALRSAGAYSDSGFESSTSSGVAAKISGSNNHHQNHFHHHHHHHHHSLHNPHNETQKAIEQLKSEMLQPLTKTKTAELLPPDLLDEPMEEAVDFDHPDFHSFTTRLNIRRNSSNTVTNTTETTPASCNEGYRHLSIDTKDSGIQCCDSSNSALPASSNGVTHPMPPVTSFSDSGGGGGGGTDDATHTNRAENKQTPTSSEEETNEMKQQQQDKQNQSLSAAERLIDGTYYWHESSSSYVFPGAQVSWCMDSEDDLVQDDDDDEDDDADINEINDDGEKENVLNVQEEAVAAAEFEDAAIDNQDGNGKHGSSLTSVNTEMVNEISTTVNVFNTGSSSITTMSAITATTSTVFNTHLSGSSKKSCSFKRHSTETIETEDDDNEEDIDDEETVTATTVMSLTAAGITNSTIADTTATKPAHLHSKDSKILAGDILLCSPPPLKRRRDSSNSPHGNSNHNDNSNCNTMDTTTSAVETRQKETISCNVNEADFPQTTVAAVVSSYSTNSTCNKLNTITTTSPSNLTALAATPAATTIPTSTSSSMSALCSSSSSSSSNALTLKTSSSDCSSLSIDTTPTPPADALLQQI